MRQKREVRKQGHRPTVRCELLRQLGAKLRIQISSVWGYSQKQRARAILSSAPASQIGKLFQQRELVVQRLVQHLFGNLVVGILLKLFQRSGNGLFDDTHVAIEYFTHFRAPRSEERRV